MIGNDNDILETETHSQDYNTDEWHGPIMAIRSELMAITRELRAIRQQMTRDALRSAGITRLGVNVDDVEL